MKRPTSRDLRERARLAALGRFRVLDTPPVEAFARITRLASKALRMPVAVVSLDESAVGWFKSSGDSATSFTREVDFCARATRSGSVLVCDDLALDPRFRDDPLVTTDPATRFFAGAPLVSADGQHLGALGVFDRQPRVLTTSARESLVDLAALVVDALETRLIAIELNRGQQRTSAILDALAEGVIVSDPDGVYTVVNEAARRLIGLVDRGAIRSLREASALLTEAGAPLPVDETPLARALRGDDTSGQRIALDVHGSRRLFSVSGRSVREPDGSIDAAVSTFVDITEADLAQRQLRHKANTDGLTGLFNRAALDAHLDRLPHSSQDVTVIMLDIDHFKRLNDTQGHLEGDRVLTLVASVLRGSLRETDFVARYGGEEFCVVLVNVGASGAASIAEKLRAAVEATQCVTASFGVCTATSTLLRPRDMLARADEALFAAKTAGRNRVTVSSAQSG